MERDIDSVSPCYDKLTKTAQGHIDQAVAKLYEHLRSVGVDLSSTPHVLPVTEATAAWVIATGNAKWLADTRARPQDTTASSNEIMEWWRLNWRDPKVYVAGHYIPFDKTPDDGT